MQVYYPAVTGALQLPLYNVDPATTSSGNIWFNTNGTGSLKYATVSGSFVVTKILTN